VKAGEIARRAGVSVETLRYYERRRLLPEPAWTTGGHRRYDEEAVRFLRAIKEAQAIGFTLAEIEEYLRVVQRGRVPAPEALRSRVAVKIDEIDVRMAALRRMRDELARIVGCACESLDHCTCGAAYLARRGRESTARPSQLHVTSGESAGNTLRQTSLGRPGRFARRVAACPQPRSNWPARTWAVKARHSSGAKTSTGPSGSFESRTATRPGRLPATSTHAPPLVLL
jgi:DNA-binding transcriptional MerR regulator